MPSMTAVRNRKKQEIVCLWVLSAAGR